MKLPEHFILIDDDPFNNILNKIVLNKAFSNTKVIGFTEPEDGLDYIIKQYSTTPVSTVIFLDINMPTLTGWEVMDKISTYSDRWKDKITIFLLSSSIDPQDKRKAAQNPLVRDYLEKPLSIELVVSLFNSND